VRVVRTAYGARLMHGRSYLSKVLRRPGPTHEVFDVLAAALALAPSGDAALLGFAGGSMIAPLRALGDARAIDAVDLDPAGEDVFRTLCGRWSGAVRVARGDAAAWLRSRRRRYRAIVEDLSADGADGATKPTASLDRVPAAVAARLAATGVLVVNALPVPGMPWGALLDRLSAGLPDRRVVHLRDHENRVLLAARALPSARRIAADLRASLAAIGSRQADRLSVRAVQKITR